MMVKASAAGQADAPAPTGVAAGFAGISSGMRLRPTASARLAGDRSAASGPIITHQPMVFHSDKGLVVEERS